MPDPTGPWGAPTPRRRATRLGLVLWLAGLALIGVLLWLLTGAFPGQDTPINDPYLWRMVAVLALVSSGLLFIRDINLKQAFRNILAWVGVAGVLMVGYSYWDTLRDAGLRLRADLIPAYAIDSGPREMTIAQSDGGDYLVYGAVNGAPVRFLVDTGASDIVLSPADAKRAGINPASLHFDHVYETANGTGRGASFRVASLAVGKLNLSDVPVSINQAGMSSSLLGMTFLRQVKSFRFSDHRLTINW